MILKCNLARLKPETKKQKNKMQLNNGAKQSGSSPGCSDAVSNTQEIRIDQETDIVSITSKELCTHQLDNIISSEAYNDCTLQRISLRENDSSLTTPTTSVPLLLHLPLTMSTQPLRILSNLPSPISLNLQATNEPQTLFLQALAKLNESSLSIAIANKRINTLQLNNNIANNLDKTQEISPPDSLTSAPPSYSFVLRQMARRRPRLMGTFIPSPSFIQHTPPPNYATAFDIYVDNHIPRPPTRVYNFGFAPIPIVCPECGYTGMTIIASKITLCTHLCAIILCLLCCWICAPLPYVLRSCKDVYHYCRNCRNFLGMYCPTNPESAYT